MIGCIFCLLCYSKQLIAWRNEPVNVTILAMYSLEGSLAYFPHIPEFLSLWQDHLNERLRNVPSWPFSAQVEFFDAKSDPHYSSNYLLSRINNRSLPNVSVVLGPESTVGLSVAATAAKIGMPVVLVESIPDPSLSTTFFTIPKTMYKCRALVDEFLQIGVRSMVAVAMLESYETYNYDTCFDTANLAASRGIKTTKLIMFENYLLSDVVHVVRSIRDEYNPDVILWCDWESCQVPELVFRNPLLAFKEANYLPKALTMLDCVGLPNFQTPDWTSLFQYVTSGMFTHVKLRGTDYTEDATPYSSLFRPKNSLNVTVINLVSSYICA